MKKLFYALVFSLFIISYANASAFDDALLEVKGTDKLILVELEQDFCPYCKRMEETVLQKDDVKKILHEKYVFVKLNIKKDYIPEILTSRATPTFYFLSQDGEKVLESLIGLRKKSEFVFYLNEIYAQEAK